MGKKLFEKLLDGLLSPIWSWILAGLLMLGTIIWTALLSWAGPLILIAALASLGFALFAINQTKIVRQAWKDKQPATSDEIKTRLIEWLLKAGNKVGIKTNPDEYFTIESIDPQSRLVTVAQPKNYPQMISVAMRLVLPQRKKLNLKPAMRMYVLRLWKNSLLKY